MKQRIKGLLSIWLVAAVLLTTLGIVPVAVSAEGETPSETQDFQLYLPDGIPEGEVDGDQIKTVSETSFTDAATTFATAAAEHMTGKDAPLGWEIWELYTSGGITSLNERADVKEPDWAPDAEDFTNYANTGYVVIPKYTLTVIVGTKGRALKAEEKVDVNKISVLPGVPFNDARQTQLQNYLDGYDIMGYNLWTTTGPDTDGLFTLNQKQNTELLPVNGTIDNTLATALLTEEFAGRIPVLDAAFLHKVVYYIDQTADGSQPLETNETFNPSNVNWTWETYDRSKSIWENYTVTFLEVPAGKVVTGWKLWGGMVDSGVVTPVTRLYNGAEDTTAYATTGTVATADMLKAWAEMDKNSSSWVSTIILEAVLEDEKITQQPAKTNNYTVISTGPEVLKTYAWYKVGEENDQTQVDGQTTNVFAPTNVEEGNYLVKITYTSGTVLTSDVFAYTKSSGSSSSSSISGLPGSSYIVNFETNGGGLITAQRVKVGKTVTQPEEPKKEGYLFGGWYTDEELTEEFDFATKVTKNFTLYAKWTAEEEEETPDEPDMAFEDVTPDDWFYDAVDYMVKKGYMNGVSNLNFGPDDPITRGMFITILYRIENQPETSTAQIFKDIDAEVYYSAAVVWGYENGIINGVSENEYAPDLLITREQIATMIYRYANVKGYDTTKLDDLGGYRDIYKISQYAMPAMQYMVGAGLMQGKTTTELYPGDNATRAEVATILKRFIEYYEQ